MPRNQFFAELAGRVAHLCLSSWSNKLQSAPRKGICGIFNPRCVWSWLGLHMAFCVKLPKLSATLQLLSAILLVLSLQLLSTTGPHLLLQLKDLQAT